MSTFAKSTTIDAPLDLVWSSLADIGSIHVWNPGVQDSHITSGHDSGLGATRYCDLGGRNFLNEEVVEFHDRRLLTMRITDSNLPFRHADIQFRLEATGDSMKVSVTPDYRLKFGPIGVMMDRIFVRRVYEKGMADSVIVQVERDGNTYYDIRDYDKLRELFADLLRIAHHRAVQPVDHLCFALDGSQLHACGIDESGLAYGSGSLWLLDEESGAA